MLFLARPGNLKVPAALSLASTACSGGVNGLGKEIGSFLVFFGKTRKPFLPPARLPIPKRGRGEQLSMQGADFTDCLGLPSIGKGGRAKSGQKKRKKDKKGAKNATMGCDHGKSGGLGSTDAC